MNILLIGFGEVGRALCQVLRKKYKVDVVDAEGITRRPDTNDLLFITFPYSKRFEQYVKTYQKIIKPKETIIFSTVPIGTCRKLKAIHSPIEGKHPSLAKSIKIHKRWFGGTKCLLTVKVFKSLNISCKVEKNPEYTEFLKLRSTSLYGVNIEFARYSKKVTDKLGMNFNLVKEFDKDYNDLYKKMNLPQFQRYILNPPKGKGINGHCVLENSIVLYKQYPSDLLLGVMALGKNPELILEKKPYFNTTWLWCEHWGKQRTLTAIGKQFNVSGENIGAIMKKRGIPVRKSNWTKEELRKIIYLASKGKTFKEISKIISNRNYDAIRNMAYKELKIKSSYNPAVRDFKTRQKISASLQGITKEEWNGFKETVNSLIRKSCEYKKWREKVFKRDNYTCQKCGLKSKKGLGTSVYLEAHHIKSFAKYPKLRFKVSNGMTLCEDCHKLTNNYKGRTRK